MRIGAAVGLGLLCAAIAQLFALFMAGAGHGWITPFWFSIPLWVLIPTAFAVSSPKRGYEPRKRSLIITLVIIGFLLDVGVVWKTLEEGTQYFWKVMGEGAPFALVWIALFGAWQLATAATLAVGARPDLS